MKKVIYFGLICILLIALSCKSNNDSKKANTENAIVADSSKSQASNLNDKEITIMLKDFYTNYMIEGSIVPENTKRVDSILKKYCTKALLKQLNNKDIDWDLLLDGQICEREWLNTLSINKDNNNDSIYNVSFNYIDDGAKVQKNIKLQIVKNNKDFKINKVLY